MSGPHFNAVAKLCPYVPLDLHTEAVHAALAKYKERKMPMPSKRRSVLVQSSVEACTPPGETSVPVNPLSMQGRVYPVARYLCMHLCYGCTKMFTCVPMSIVTDTVVSSDPR